MPATAIRMAVNNNRPERLTKKRLQEKLRHYEVGRIHTVSLSGLQMEDLRKVLFVRRRNDPILIFPIRKAQKLFPGLRRKEAPLRMTALRSMGITLDSSFDDKFIDTYVVRYCEDDRAVLVAASRLLEHLG